MGSVVRAPHSRSACPRACPAGEVYDRVSTEDTRISNLPDLPYRTAASLPAALVPPVELTYVARDRDVNRAFHRMVIGAWLFGVCGSMVIATVGSPPGALVFMLVVVAWSVWRWRRTRQGKAIVFRVEHGELTVSVRTARGGARPLVAKLPLMRLRDVTLDTKAITPVTRDTSISAIAVQAKIHGEVDVARIVLVPMAPHEPVPLTEEHLAHMDAVEGAGKIRTFLRAHGWLPEDERGVEAERGLSAR